MSTTLEEPANIASHLLRMATLQPDSLAVAVATAPDCYVELSYAELNRLVDRTAHALCAVGITRGTRTVVMVQPSPELFAVTFALFKIGAVPVMVDPGMGVTNLGQCLEEAEPVAFIGTPKAHLARRLFRWAKPSLEILITVGPRWFSGGQRLASILETAPNDPFEMEGVDPDQMAAIFFTSGSTGTPKGVIYRHPNFTAQVRLLRDVYGIAPGEVDLATLPLFALFGPGLGMSSVVPFMDASRPATADPHHLVSALEKYSCTNMFVSPALVEKLGRHCEATNTQLIGLQRVLSAGAPASPTALERLQRHLPQGVEIFTPYGATEALPVASVGSQTILGNTRTKTDSGAGVCVGHPVPEATVRIIPITDDPVPFWSADSALPANEIGEIIVQGPMVTHGYYRRADATELARIMDGDRVFHRMGDLGYLDENGLLWMCGRKTHRVVTSVGTLFTVPCEAVFNTHASVFRTALVGVRGVPVLCVELEQSERPSDALTDELRTIGKNFEHTRDIETFLYHKSFPVDVRHNAKILRERLAQWASGRVPGR